MSVLPCNVYLLKSYSIEPHFRRVKQNNHDAEYMLICMGVCVSYFKLTCTYRLFIAFSLFFLFTWKLIVGPSRLPDKKKQ